MFKKSVLFFLIFLFPAALLHAEEAKPGQPGIYKVVQPLAGPYAGQTVLDLGFSNFLRFGDLKHFAPGDLIFAQPPVHPEKGLAGMYTFQRVYPESARYELHLNFPKNPIFGDESLLYTYPAYVVRVEDAETFRVLADLGFGLTTEQRVRMNSFHAATKEALEKKLMEEGGKILVRVVDMGKSEVPSVEVWVKNKNIRA